jgi:hypothetical protein
MANVTVTKGGGPADLADNFPGNGPQDYHDERREYKPTNERPDWRVVVAQGAVLVAGVLALWLAYGAWKTAYCWGGANWGACASINAAEPLAIALLLLGAALLVGGRSWVRIRNEALMGTARAARVATTYNRFGDPQRVDVLLPLMEEVERYRLATELKRATAPFETLHSINTYSPTFAKPEAPPALPAPAETAQLVAPDTWLTWLAEQPHTMVAGATGSGKTTFARVALGERLRAGYGGLVVDPKGKEWYGLPVVGGGRKFAEILATLDAVRAEMDARFEAYGQGERSFTPLVVLVDEVPDIMDACLDDRRRLRDGRWVRFVRQLGSLAREVQISVVLLTQSPLVEDIGMNSAMRKNFTRVALGDEAPLLLREERDPKRRAQLQELLKGQAHPAALYRRGEVHLLDTASVPQLAERAAPGAQGWMPAAVDLRPRTTLADAINRAKAQGWTRQQARAAGLRFDNNEWGDRAG